jgi:hypothetical protein
VLKTTSASAAAASLWRRWTRICGHSAIYAPTRTGAASSSCHTRASVARGASPETSCSCCTRRFRASSCGPAAGDAGAYSHMRVLAQARPRQTPLCSHADVGQPKRSPAASRVSHSAASCYAQMPSRPRVAGGNAGGGGAISTSAPPDRRFHESSGWRWVCK